MSAIGGKPDEPYRYASIERSPMRGIDRRYTVTYLQPWATNGFVEQGAMTLLGARRLARRIDRAHDQRKRIT